MTLEAGMNIGWPEGIWLTIVTINVAIHLVKNDQSLPENQSKYSFSYRLAGALISGILLYWGGFFA